MDKLRQDAKSLFGIQLQNWQITALETYTKELLEWSGKFNLTAIRDENGIHTKHFLDSFSCIQAWKNKPPTSLIDIGTGAGFPGIPLKILYPRLQLTLVESVGKKADFCRHIVERLNLTEVEVIHARAEDVGHLKNHRESYELAIARAVARLPVLVEYLLPLVKVGGYILAQKGDTGPAEAHSAEFAINLLGGHIRQLVPITLPGVVEERYLIVIDKIATTPPGYPRKAGFPTKDPLKRKAILN